MTDISSYVSTLKKEYHLNDPTLYKLDQYVNLLIKWSAAYNLIGPNEINNLWTRHIPESIFLTHYLPSTVINTRIIDLGSGAGFPGMILALLGYKDVFLVERTAKKCIFLKTVSHETSTPVQIFNSRIEDLESSLKVDVLTSRALADLSTLLKYSKNLLNPSGYCLFFKGEKVNDEIKEAEKKYHFTYTIFQTSKKNAPIILKASDIIEK